MMRLFLHKQASQALQRQTLMRKPFSTASMRRAVDPAAPKPKKTHRIRNTLLTTTVLLVGGFAGCVYMSVQSDSFYAYFTNYVPLSGLVVDYVDDFLFRQQMRGHTSAPHQSESARPELVNVGGSYKAKADPADMAQRSVQIAPSKKADKAVEKPQGGEATKDKAEPAKDKAGEKDTHEMTITPAAPKAAPGPTTEAGVPLESAYPAKAEQIDEKVLEGKLIDPITGVAADELDPIVATLVDTLNSTLRANGVKLQEEDYMSLLTDHFEKASSDLKRRRALLLQEKEDALAQQKSVLEKKYDADYVDSKLKLVESYNQRLQLALDAITTKAVAAANNKLAAQNVELTEKFARDVNNLVEEERGGRLSQIQELKKDIATLQEAMLSSGQILESEDGVVAFFVELANLQRVLTGDKTVPLQPYLDSLKHSLPSDPLVKAVFDSVSPSVKKYGVLSHPQLAARFSLIEPEIRRASLVPPDAGIAGHLGSLAASQLLAKKEGLPSGDDVESVIARTQTYLQQGDVLRAVAQVNSLQGWPKRIAGDWLDEGRKRSEVEFLVSVLADEGRLWSVSRK